MPDERRAPVTTISKLRPPQREQTSRRRHSGTGVSGPYQRAGNVTENPVGVSGGSDRMSAWLRSARKRNSTAPILPRGPVLDFEVTYCAERKRSNLLMVNYCDLLANLDGEMRRVSAFLDIPINEEVWPALVKAAQFSEMRASADEIGSRIRTVGRRATVNAVIAPSHLIACGG